MFFNFQPLKVKKFNWREGELDSSIKKKLFFGLERNLERVFGAHVRSYS